ncbi:MAG: extracellular solute-binding protein, partial [Propionibacteriaceae bacterium]|nr:extracellular solute-binding protein [Propionibacteriaceae bacterium]
MRRSIITIGVAALLCAPLAACAGQTPAPEQSSPAPTTAAPTETAAQTPDYTGITLTMWVDQDRFKAVDGAAKQFSEATNAKITLVTKDAGKMRDEFTAAFAANTAPDILLGAHDWLGGLIQNGAVSPIPLGAQAADFTKVAVDAFTYEGQTYGVPYAIENIAMIRNTKHAAE